MRKGNMQSKQYKVNFDLLSLKYQRYCPVAGQIYKPVYQKTVWAEDKFGS